MIPSIYGPPEDNRDAPPQPPIVGVDKRLWCPACKYQLNRKWPPDRCPECLQRIERAKPEPTK